MGGIQKNRGGLEARPRQAIVGRPSLTFFLWATTTPLPYHRRLDLPMRRRDARYSRASLPMLELHLPQHARRLATSWLPPRLSGTMWSAVVARPPQRKQRKADASS